MFRAFFPRPVGVRETLDGSVEFGFCQRGTSRAKTNGGATSLFDALFLRPVGVRVTLDTFAEIGFGRRCFRRVWRLGRRQRPCGHPDGVHPASKHLAGSLVANGGLGWYDQDRVDHRVRARGCCQIEPCHATGVQL